MVMKILRALNNTFVYHGFFAVLLGASLLPYYSGGSMILGGEGHYILDFHLLSKVYSYAWIDLATGLTATSFNFNFFLTFFLSFVETLLKNERAVNFLVVFMIFYLPFFSMFKAARLLEKSPFYAFLAAFFYVVNPFSLYGLGFINIWNYLIFFMVPMSFWFIVRFYDDPRFFLFFGLFTALFAFTNANPPLLLIFQVSLFMSTAFAVLLREERFTLSKFLRKYLLAVFSFAVFNIWWIFVWLQALSTDIPKMYTSGFAVNYAKDYAEALRPLPLKIFSLTGLVVLYRPGDIYQYLYNLPVSYFITLVPVGIVVFSLIQYKNLAKDKIALFLLSSYAILIFLSKGPAGFLGFLYSWALSHVPFFSVFKSPVEKWGVLLIFFFTLLLLFSFKNFKGGKKKPAVIFFIGYLLFCSIPFFKFSLVPDNTMSDGHISSRKFIDKSEYLSFRKAMAEDPVTYRILSLPGSLNYQVALDLGLGRSYTGMDPVVSNTGRQFIAAYSSNYISGFDVLFDNLTEDHLPEILKLYNIGKIVINRDTLPWFGYREKIPPEDLSRSLASSMAGERNGAIEVFNAPLFLPRIYSSGASQIVDGDISGLPALAERKMIPKKPVILFKEYNDPAELSHLAKARPTAARVSPDIVFRRVNPTKYIVQFTNPGDPFWLVFLESFHKKWKIFPAGPLESRDGNEGDIVAEHTDLGVREKRSLERFSLRDVKYLFTKPMETRHFNVNGYANGWFLDPGKLSTGPSITLVLFFLPQAHAYLGFLISLAGFLISVLVLLLKKPKK